MRAGVLQFLENYISLYLPISPYISSSSRAWASTRRIYSSGPTARPSRRAAPTSTFTLTLIRTLTLTPTPDQARRPDLQISGFRDKSIRNGLFLNAVLGVVAP